jgi:hypothetical protein
MQEQWWGHLVLTFRRAVAFTKRIANGGVSDLASRDFKDLEGLILALVKETGYRAETL